MIFDPTGKEQLRMTDSNIIWRYIHGGKGVVTLYNPENHKAHAYRFSFPRNSVDFPEGTIFVYVLHESKSFYLGKLLDSGQFTLTNASKFGRDTDAVKGAEYITYMSVSQKFAEAESMHLYHSGRCCKCGRELLDSESIAAGIGKKCCAKYNILTSGEPWDGTV